MEEVKQGYQSLSPSKWDCKYCVVFMDKGTGKGFWRDASFKVIRSGSANVVKAVRGSDRKFGGVLQASRLL